MGQFKMVEGVQKWENESVDISGLGKWSENFINQKLMKQWKISFF